MKRRPAVECKMCRGECWGPCYDLCDCKHCWRNWSGYSFRTKLGWRIQRIWRDLRGHDPWA